MKQLKKLTLLVQMLVMGLFIMLIGYSGYSLVHYANRWFSSSANTFSRRVKSNVIAGNIYDRNGVLLATTNEQGKREYNAEENIRRSVVHVIGDAANNVGHGAETFMANHLYGFNTPLYQKLISWVKGEKPKGNHIMLSIDSKLSAYISSIFPTQKKGAVVVMNYRTGEVLSLQSFPSFDPLRINQQVKEDPLKPFWNNATRWCSAPGSTFKIITLASALKNIPALSTKTFTCNGALPVLDTFISDAGGAIHGDLNIEKAFLVSCNHVFSSLAMELGDAQLKNTSKNFGIGESFLFPDMVVEDSKYPENKNNSKLLAWTGIGQGALQVTPLHMCMITSSIADDGVMMQPKLLMQTIDGYHGGRTEQASKAYLTPLSKEDPTYIKRLMEKVVIEGTGQKAAVPGHRICGKTGTADIDHQAQSNAWFVGFIDELDLPYSISVVIIDGGGGGSVAAPIAKSIFEHLILNKP